MEESDVKALFSRWGTVKTLTRGTSAISSQDGEVGVWGSGWVWNSEWNVRIVCSFEKDIPPCILAAGDVWQGRYPGAPTVCFLCGDTSHLASHCQAIRRREGVVNKWEEEMGPTVEIFFPTKRRQKMSESDFKLEQKRNLERGEKFGIRGTKEDGLDFFAEINEKDNIIADLDNKLKIMSKTVDEAQGKVRSIKDLKDKLGKLENDYEAKTNVLKEREISLQEKDRNLEKVTMEKIKLEEVFNNKIKALEEKNKNDAVIMADREKQFTKKASDIVKSKNAEIIDLRETLKLKQMLIESKMDENNERTEALSKRKAEVSDSNIRNSKLRPTDEKVCGKVEGDCVKNSDTNPAEKISNVSPTDKGKVKALNDDKIG